jgi:DNA-binding response OmpR family regulator
MRIVRILMVEDEPSVVAQYRLQLEVDGFPVQVANTGEAALSLARRSRWSLVLLDLGLTGMSGLDVLAALRRDASTADLPVVVLANRHDELLDRACALGAIDYLIKTRTTPAQASRSVLRWIAMRRARPMSAPVQVAADTVVDAVSGSGA